jgi:hypothetical protein
MESRYAQKSRSSKTGFGRAGPHRLLAVHLAASFDDLAGDFSANSLKKGCRGG